MFKRLFIIASFTFTAIAAAQAPAPPAPAAVSAAAQPTHKCMRPEHPGRLATNNQLKTFNNDAKLYSECLRTFVNAQAELVKFHSEIGNNAVKEFNDYVAEMNKKKDDAVK